MNGSVIIKGTRNGLSIVLDENEEFETLKEKVASKFKDSAKFLGNAKTAVSFEGRKLTEEQTDELVGCITENTELEIVCILDRSDEGNAPFEQAIEKKMAEMSSSMARIHKGYLRSGQALESDTGLIVIGDVNPGASLKANGNIIVLGSLRGMAWAGAGGNTGCFVMASDMMPVQIRIADTIARAPDRQESISDKSTRVAFLDGNGSICITPLSKEAVAQLNY